MCQDHGLSERRRLGWQPCGDWLTTEAIVMTLELSVSSLLNHGLNEPTPSVPLVALWMMQTLTLLRLWEALRWILTCPKLERMQVVVQTSSDSQTTSILHVTRSHPDPTALRILTCDYLATGVWLHRSASAHHVATRPTPLPNA